MASASHQNMRDRRSGAGGSAMAVATSGGWPMPPRADDTSGSSAGCCINRSYDVCATQTQPLKIAGWNRLPDKAPAARTLVARRLRHRHGDWPVLGLMEFGGRRNEEHRQVGFNAPQECV